VVGRRSFGGILYQLLANGVQHDATLPRSSLPPIDGSAPAILDEAEVVRHTRRTAWRFGSVMESKGLLEVRGGESRRKGKDGAWARAGHDRGERAPTGGGRKGREGKKIEPVYSLGGGNFM
jgi:hypothetical protein